MVNLAARENVKQVNATCWSTSELRHAEEIEDGYETIVNGDRVSSRTVKITNNQKTLANWPLSSSKNWQFGLDVGSR